MDMMLKTLNIDLQLIGYNKEAQRWEGWKHYSQQLQALSYQLYRHNEFSLRGTAT